MFKDGNINQVKQLLIPAKRVIKDGISIDNENYEIRIGLWNEIRENREKYQNGGCGAFLPELDTQFLSEFDISLLILSNVFSQDTIEFEPAKNFFSKKELMIYEMIQRYNSLEFLSVQDILKKINRKDEKVLELLKEYYLGMDPWVEKTLEDNSVRITIRYYLKKKWDFYKSKINLAVSQASLQLDWLRNNLQQWQEFTESEKIKLFEGALEDATKKAETDLVNEKEHLSTQKKFLIEFESALRQKESKIHKADQELTEKQNKIVSDLERIQEIIKTPGENPSSGSRFVTTEMACQYEINFIGRIQQRLKNQIVLNNATYKSEKIKYNSESKDSKKNPTPQNSAKNPENISIISLIKRANPLYIVGSKYIIKACYVSRLNKYIQDGYDLDPLKLEEVTPIIKENLEIVNKNKTPRFLCIASPTGFEPAAEGFIYGDKRYKNFISPHLKVCFVDLDTGKVNFNKNDPLCKDFAHFCELEFESERKEKIYRCVETTLMNMASKRDFVVYSDIEKMCGKNPLTKSAFYDYAESHNHIIRYISEIGLVIDFKVSAT